MFCKSALVAAVLVGLAMAGPGGNRGDGPEGPRKLPEFLQGVSEEARKEFGDIIKNEELTIADQRSQLLAWAQKNGLGDKVTEFEQKIQEKVESIKAAVAADGSIPSDKLAEVGEILKNESQTRKQQMEALKKFKESNPEIAETLKNIIKPEMGLEN